MLPKDARPNKGMRPVVLEFLARHTASLINKEWVHELLSKNCGALYRELMIKMIDLGEIKDA